MSEGPPKEPKQPVEAIPEQIDTQAAFAHVHGVVGELDTLVLPGKARRALEALRAAERNLEYALRNRIAAGPQHILYVRALEAIVQDDEMWKLEADMSGADSADLKRRLLQKSLTDLEAAQIEQFPFTGRTQ